MTSNSWGNNVFIKYTGGNDSIYGLNATSTLKIASGTMNSVITTNGSDLFLSVGKSTITLSSAVDYADKLNIVNSKGKAIKYKLNKKIVGSNGNDDIFNSLVRATISSGAGDDTIRNLEDNVSISGGAGDDLIENRGNKVTIKGGKGNDTLVSWKNDSWGDAVNDTLYGGSGNDVFVYMPGKGTDRIMDYESGDMLQILKADGSEGGSFKSSKFSGGDLTLTTNGGGKVILENVTASDKFNINGKTYTISGTKLVK